MVASKQKALVSDHFDHGFFEKKTMEKKKEDVCGEKRRSLMKKVCNICLAQFFPKDSLF